jgi:hypothetical protein
MYHAIRKPPFFKELFKLFQGFDFFFAVDIKPVINNLDLAGGIAEKRCDIDGQEACYNPFCVGDRNNIPVA